MGTSSDSATIVGSLDTTVPADNGVDGKRTNGAAEIRQVKTALKTTFANVTGAVTATHTQLNYLTGKSLTGSDTNIVTGTAGTAGDLVVWDANGDAVDGPTPPSGTIVGTTDSQTLTNKTLTSPDINGGTIDGVTIGGASAGAGTFTNLTVSGTVSLPNDSIQVADIGAGTLPSDVKVNGDNWSGTDLAVVNGGTGASDAATARSNLGLAIGTNVQAYDADLTALAGLAKTDGNFIVGNGSAWVAESGATARASLGLGSIATQAANSINIDGGVIDGTAIGASSASTGAFTTLSATGNVTLGNATSDTVTCNARIASHLNPSATQTYNLGDASYIWDTAYIENVNLTGPTDTYLFAMYRAGVDFYRIGNASNRAAITIDTDGQEMNFLTNNGSVVRCMANGSFKYNPKTAPSSPTAGEVYYDSTANKLKVYTGSAWETITSA